MIEIEIRARITNHNKIKARVIGLDGKFLKIEHQIDKVFGRKKDLDERQKIIEGHFSARIRQIDDDIKVEFKEIRRSGSGLEFSSKIHKIDDGVKLLKKLDFEEAFTISKTRESFDLNGFTICLDKVMELGDFVEIEHLSENNENIDHTVEECKALLSKLDPKAILEPKKYGDLMQELINNRGKNGF